MKILYVGMDGTEYFKVDEKGNKKYDRSLELEISDELVKLGHHVTLVVERMPYYDEIPENMEIIVAPINTTLLTEEEIHTMIKGDYDIAFASSASGGYIVNFAAKKRNIPSVVQLLDIPFFRLHSVFEQLGIHHWRKNWNFWLAETIKADAIVVNSSSTIGSLKTLCGDEIEKKIKLIHYGINSVVADKIPDQEKIYDICFVSRLVFYKGLHLLLYALYMLKLQGIEPKVAVIGAGEELMNSLLTVKMLDLKNIDFLGARDNETKWKIIKQSKIGVVPEFCENIGSLAPMEFMYAKIPVICWDMKIHREKCLDFPFYVYMFDIKKLAENIHSLLFFKREKKYFEEAHKFTKENRTIEVQGKELIKFFEEVIKNFNPS